MEFLNTLFGIAVYAEGNAISSDFFGVLANGANVFVNIIKWAALLYVLIKIAALGFKITTSSKNSSDALSTLKEEGLALFIGFFIVMTCFLIHGALKSTVSNIGGNKVDTSISISQSDVF